MGLVALSIGPCLSSLIGVKQLEISVPSHQEPNIWSSQVRRDPLGPLVGVEGSRAIEADRFLFFSCENCCEDGYTLRKN